MVLPVRRREQEFLDGNRNASFCTIYRLNFMGLRLNFVFLKGGSFLYVATVLQPVSSGGTAGLPHEDDISAKTRLTFIVLGMFAPLLLSVLVGHGHS